MLRQLSQLRFVLYFARQAHSIITPLTVDLLEFNVKLACQRVSSSRQIKGRDEGFNPPPLSSLCLISHGVAGPQIPLDMDFHLPYSLLITLLNPKSIKRHPKAYKVNPVFSEISKTSLTVFTGKSATLRKCHIWDKKLSGSAPE